MTKDEEKIAKRWCILNSWGWPDDVPMPLSPVERYNVAHDEMRKAVRAIGIQKCLEYWNSEEFMGLTVKIEREYSRP